MSYGYIPLPYGGLPYHYPFEGYPVVRIPVAGPEPYNTLVVARGVFPLLDAVVPADGKLRSWHGQVATSFNLVGFDPRVPPAFTHSTTAVIQLIQDSNGGGFLWAADEVSGSFDNRGNWVVSVIVTSGSDGGWAYAGGYVSSWVLCYEPPPPELPRGKAARSAPVQSGQFEKVSVSGPYLRTRIGTRRNRTLGAASVDRAGHPSMTPPVSIPAAIQGPAQSRHTRSTKQ